MEFFVNVALVTFGTTSGLVAVFRQTTTDNGRLSRLGWFLLSLAVLAFALSVAKEVISKQHKDLSEERIVGLTAALTRIEPKYDRLVQLLESLPARVEGARPRGTERAASTPGVVEGTISDTAGRPLTTPVKVQAIDTAGRLIGEATSRAGHYRLTINAADSADAGKSVSLLFAAPGHPPVSAQRLNAAAGMTLNIVM